MVSDEFEALWDTQRNHHSELLSEKAHGYLKDSLLFQRRLLPVLPGRCLFETDEYRAPLASPLQQEFRILQELNNLRLEAGGESRALNLQEQQALFTELNRKPGMHTFSALRRLIGIGKSMHFNLESEKRKGLSGNTTRGQFISEDAFGDAWDTFGAEVQEGLALLLVRATEDDALQAALIALPDTDKARDVIRPKPHEAQFVSALSTLPIRVSPEQALRISKITLPDDYGSLSLKALRQIVPELKREVVTYDKAVQAAGYNHHSQLYTGEFFTKLPYYGQLLRSYTSPADKAKDQEERAFGKIANPTVHIGLNQLRQLLNALIRRYGHPKEIVLEMAREFGVSGEHRREIQKKQAENQERNAAYDKRLQALGQKPNRENRQRLQLWEELGKDDALDRHCVYSGKRISMAMLFSDEIEIDHILPFSRTLNDGIGNKILCTRQSNRDKGNRTPFEAWGHTQQWDGILERATRLPGKKPLLFREHAVEGFLGGQDFLDRQLTDTAYLSRAAKQYLCGICPPNCIWVNTGRLTGMLRAKWGLNALLSDDAEKNRNDHRHHALDAAVIGACSRSVIKGVADAARRAETEGQERLLSRLPYPWPSFRADLQDTLAKINVSHKPDHGVETALHNDTNYGLKEAAGENAKQPLVARYVSIEAIAEKDLDALLDERVKSGLRQIFTNGGKATEIKAAIAEFSARTGIRRVKKTERLAVIPIHNRKTGQPYRYVKGDGNYCYEIFLNEKGKWDGIVVSNFDANKDSYDPNGRTALNGKPLVMRIRKGDILALNISGNKKLYRVATFTSGIIALAEPHEANVDARDRNKSLPYLRKGPATLQALEAKISGIDILGYVNTKT